MGWKEEEEETRVTKNNKKKELRAMAGAVKFFIFQFNLMMELETGKVQRKGV